MLSVYFWTTCIAVIKGVPVFAVPLPSFDDPILEASWWPSGQYFQQDHEIPG